VSRRTAELPGRRQSAFALIPTRSATLAQRSVRRSTSSDEPDRLVLYCQRRDFAIQPIPESILFQFQVVPYLQVEPESVRRSKEPRQSQGCICRNRPLASNNLIDASWWNADILGQTILADPQGREILFQKNLAWMDWGWLTSWHECASMIVNNLDLVGVAGLPAKTNTPLIVDPNTVLALSISAEFFQTISRRDTQVVERFRGVEKQ
jgi:hypothetical protein